MLSRLSRASATAAAMRSAVALSGQGDDQLIAIQEELLITLGEMNRLIQVAVIIVDSSDLTEVG